MSVVLFCWRWSVDYQEHITMNNCWWTTQQADGGKQKYNKHDKNGRPVCPGSIKWGS